MESWIFYAGVAAFLIAMRDIFTKKFTSKYSAIEHLLYYYILCGFFIILLALYKSKVQGEKIRFIELQDLWPYLVIAFASAVIISPCQFLSLKNCDNPGKSKAIVNMNSIIAFILALYFIKGTKITAKSVFGIILASIGIYLVV
uniref:EamA domain-containing protein n=1 Tax=viral metagenome TaxID=1070528 RepID=A0A6C0FE47_9ZZZZ|tara:strand:+ start:17 stop:448 length:432 start_codon:yes stop_codon:yes gene_type:complete